MEDILVIDIGGTSFRSAIYRNSVCEYYHKTASPNFLEFPDMNIIELQSELIKIIVREFNYRKIHYPQINKICISFPGIVYEDKFISDAATLWGEKHNKINLVSILEVQTSCRVFLLNDVTAAGYKFTSDYDKFCIITVSSGIGNKCFWNKEPLLNEGLGGEIGHINIGHSIIDDSGKIGHLGAIASGRGSIKLANHLKNKLESYKYSMLNNKEINSYTLVEAFKNDDSFATEVIRSGAESLAKIINVHINSIGILKYIFIGGFATAMGDKYRLIIEEEIEKLEPYVFNKIKNNNIIIIADDSDTHCLVGCGVYVQKIIQ